MKVAEPCTICGTTNCHCKQSLVQFVELIGSASERVSTFIPTSLSEPLKARSAIIDKLTGSLIKPILLEDLESRIANSRLSFKYTRLRKEGWVIDVGGFSGGLMFHLGHSQGTTISKLISRPSAFSSFANYHGHLSQMLSMAELRNLRITRLDLALDYSLPLKNLIRGLNIDFKRARVSYLDCGAARTGMLVGKGSEKLLIYDKANELGQSAPLSRIELQLSGSKLPTRSLVDLPSALKKWTPFQGVSLNSIELNSRILMTELQIARSRKLEYLIDREGLLSARRVLNDDHNFDRDFANLISVRPWDEQPSNAFRQNIERFFKSPTKENEYGYV